MFENKGLAFYMTNLSCKMLSTLHAHPNALKSGDSYSTGMKFDVTTFKYPLSVLSTELIT